MHYLEEEAIAARALELYGEAPGSSRTSSGGLTERGREGETNVNTNHVFPSPPETPSAIMNHSSNTIDSSGQESVTNSPSHHSSSASDHHHDVLTNEDNIERDGNDAIPLFAQSTVQPNELQIGTLTKEMYTTNPLWVVDVSNLKPWKGDNDNERQTGEEMMRYQRVGINGTLVPKIEPEDEFDNGEWSEEAYITSFIAPRTGISVPIQNATNRGWTRFRGLKIARRTAVTSGCSQMGAHTCVKCSSTFRGKKRFADHVRKDHPHKKMVLATPRRHSVVSSVPIRRSTRLAARASLPLTNDAQDSNGVPDTTHPNTVLPPRVNGAELRLETAERTTRRVRADSELTVLMLDETPLDDTWKTPPREVKEELIDVEESVQMDVERRQEDGVQPTERPDERARLVRTRADCNLDESDVESDVDYPMEEQNECRVADHNLDEELDSDVEDSMEEQAKIERQALRIEPIGDRGLGSKEAKLCPFCQFQTDISPFGVDIHTRECHVAERRANAAYHCTGCNHIFCALASLERHWAIDEKCPSGKMAIRGKK